MEIASIIQEINSSKKYPSGKIQMLIDRKDESTPYLLNLLQDILRHYKQNIEYTNDHILAFYVLSQFREPLSFPYAIKYASLPADWMEKVLGDCLTESLATWMVSTFNGDLNSIKSLIENETANIFARGAGISTMVGLYRINTITREELFDYFKFLLSADLIYDYQFTTILINNIYNCHPKELYQEIKNTFNKDLIDIFLINEDSINEAIKTNREQWLEEKKGQLDFHAPVTNAIKALKESCFTIDYL